MTGKNPTIALVDKKAAYQLILECLPRSDMWFRAISARRDGSSAPAIFQVIDAVKHEFHARIGDLSDQQDVSPEWYCDVAGLNGLDVTTAYQLVISFIPRSSMWHMAVSLRTDGSSPEGVFAALDDIRQMLQIQIGNMLDYPHYIAPLLSKG